MKRTACSACWSSGTCNSNPGSELSLSAHSPEIKCHPVNHQELPSPNCDQPNISLWVLYHRIQKLIALIPSTSYQLSSDTLSIDTTRGIIVVKRVRYLYKSRHKPDHHSRGTFGTSPVAYSPSRARAPINPGIGGVQSHYSTRNKHGVSCDPKKEDQ